MMEQSEMVAALLSREGGQWLSDLARGDAVLALPTIDVALPLAELHRRVEFDLADED